MSKTYPAILFITRHGRRLAIALAAALLLAAIGGSFATGSTAGLWLGVPAAAALWALVRVASEVIEVVAETLLPR
jgi:hypothetical protein